MNRVEWIAARPGALPDLPPMVSKLLELLASEEPTEDQVHDTIASDPALARGALRMAGSSFFGLRRPPADLGAAIRLLGYDTMRSLVLASAAWSLYRTDGPRLKELMMWEHAIASALAARLIAVKRGYRTHEQAFVAGLFHDVGKVVLDQNLEAYEHVIEEVYAQCVSFLDAERRILGCDHTEMGALVVRRVRLSPAIEQAVERHHEPQEARPDPTLAAVVHLADGFCLKSEIGPAGRPDLDLQGLESTRILGLGSAELVSIWELFRTTLGREDELWGTDLPPLEGPQPSGIDRPAR